MTDLKITLIAKSDGTVELSPEGPGAELLAGRIADLLKRDSDEMRAANLAKSAPGAAVKANAEKARELELQASKWEGHVEANYYMDRELKDYYSERAAACRREAARLRGEPVEREVSIVPAAG